MHKALCRIAGAQRCNYFETQINSLTFYELNDDFGINRNDGIIGIKWMLRINWTVLLNVVAVIVIEVKGNEWIVKTAVNEVVSLCEAYREL